MLQANRFLFYAAVTVLATAFAFAGLGAAWLYTSEAGASLRRELQQRTPNEWLRYTLRRLEGHNKLEFVAHPVLHTLQQRLEREPPYPLPSLGKGQQATALPSLGNTAERLISVTDAQQLREAMRQADAGTRIQIAPGVYRFERKLQTGRAGLPGQAIVLSAEAPGTVWLEFTQAEGIVVDKPHWTIENLGMRGVCPRHDDCEHALHVVGPAAFSVIRNNRMEDFNAHIKVNGLRGQWPDHGLLAFNTLTNSRARETAKPVVPFDLVGANHWRVEDNHVSHFVKRHGNAVSYGMYMKGASEGGRFERNLVVCSPHGVSAPGVRVGLSFGGGGTGASFCRDGRCATHEHLNGYMVNNIVAHCNDTGIDINQSTGVRMLHNTLINTSGLATRGSLSQAVAAFNLIDGRIVSRDGSALVQEHNKMLDADLVFTNADALEFKWRKEPSAYSISPVPANDFYGKARSGSSIPGATQ